MAESLPEIDIPKRALFKPAEVCELVKVQPYVLRSWESEFPELGVARTAGGPKMYRRADIERVLRIKHLLLVEGLTLAGARRKLDDESMPIAADAPLDELIGLNARDRITEVKRGLRAILDLLSARTGEWQLPLPAKSAARPALARTSANPRARAEASRSKRPSSRDRAAVRRKRSA